RLEAARSEPEAELRSIFGREQRDTARELLVHAHRELDGPRLRAGSIRGEPRALLEVHPLEILAGDPHLAARRARVERLLEHGEVHAHAVEDDLGRRVVAAALALLPSL